MRCITQKDLDNIHIVLTMPTYPPPSIYLFPSCLLMQLAVVPIHAEPPRVKEDGTGGYMATLTAAPATTFLFNKRSNLKVSVV